MATRHDNDDQDTGLSIGTQMNLAADAQDGEVREFNETYAPPEKNTEQQQNEPNDEDEPGDEQDEERSARVDTELDEAATDEDREKIRARRRQERLDKKNRGRQKIETLERKLAGELAQRRALEARIQGLEQSNMGTQLATVQHHEQQAEQAENQLRQAHANAVTAGDGATATEATIRLQQLATYRENLKNTRLQLEERARKPAQQHIDPVLVANANAFRQRHSWYKGANASDPDSKVLTAVDNSLTAEGWDPATPAYWEELETRAKKYLPDRFKGGAQSAQRPHNSPSARGSSPVAGSGSSGASSQPGERKVTVHLSEARVRAMKESGAWDDPARKADMIKRYREQDAKAKLQ